MIIRVDKCSSFGIKKRSSKSIQYQPKLFVNNQLIPRIELGESFRYLGRCFDLNMSDERHKSELCDLFNDIISKIDKLPLHPRNKILLYSRYLLSKISWNLTITDISKTCFSFNFKSAINEDINKLWSITSTNKNIQYDIYKNAKDVLKAFRNENEQRLQNHLISQGSFFSSIIKNSTSSFNSLWSSVQSRLPKNIFNFTVRYINNSLPTRKTWSNGVCHRLPIVPFAPLLSHSCTSSLVVKHT
ncbi:Hypothetical predicted protein [Paramuricea clavata]|uniref:Uncharacterized protein n=1 Tax=Paramuricea clavata TaxID=317549 RepID=A0A6S7LCM9_PARCT|nr:Hypothetical predicted protein [Paramuricea clavata]